MNIVTTNIERLIFISKCAEVARCVVILLFYSEIVSSNPTKGQIQGKLIKAIYMGVATVLFLLDKKVSKTEILEQC